MAEKSDVEIADLAELLAVQYWTDGGCRTAPNMKKTATD
jgi:hypothetical protein